MNEKIQNQQIDKGTVLKIQCPFCGTWFRTYSNFVGQNVKCLCCHQLFLAKALDLAVVPDRVEIKIEEKQMLTCSFSLSTSFPCPLQNCPSQVLLASCPYRVPPVCPVLLKKIEEDAGTIAFAGLFILAVIIVTAFLLILAFIPE